MANNPLAAKPGDTISGSISHNMKFGGGKEAWLKAEASVTLQPGESFESALLRLETTQIETLRYLADAYTDYRTEENL